MGFEVTASRRQPAWSAAVRRMKQASLAQLARVDVVPTYRGLGPAW